MGNPLKFNAIKDLLAMANTDILMIQEIKINEQKSGKMLQKIRNYEGSALQATSNRGLGRYLHSVEERKMGISTSTKISTLD